MNDKARKQARRAELERTLTDAWKIDRISFGFGDWLEQEATREYGWRDEAIELIALYGEG